jgi:hypothetical protein
MGVSPVSSFLLPSWKYTDTLVLPTRRIEHLGKAQKKVKAGKKAVAGAPSAVGNVFAKEGEGGG